MIASLDPRRLAAQLPDDPGWVDFRGMLLSGRVRAWGAGANCAIRSLIYPVVAVVGRPEAGVVRRALGRDAAHAVCRSDSRTHLAAVLAGWTPVRATIHVLRRPMGPAEPDPDVRRPDRRALRAVPGPLREELLANLARCRMFARFARGRPVAFAYACWETERWFDISVNTLKAHRRRGFGTACVRALIGEMTARGKSPVWGAAETNPASMSMAVNLGFRPVDRVFVFQPSRISTGT